MQKQKQDRNEQGGGSGAGVGRSYIVKGWELNDFVVFVWNISFNSEWIKNWLNVKILFAKLFVKFSKFLFDRCERLSTYGNLN